MRRFPGTKTPKDAYSLLGVDQLIDATSRHEMLCFMDVYLGFKMIMMHPNNESHQPCMLTSTYYVTRSCLSGW